MVKLYKAFCIRCRDYTTHLDNNDQVMCGACHKVSRLPSL